MTPEGGAAEERTLLVEGEAERLDRYLAGRYPDVSRSQVQALIRSGDVLVNGAPAAKPSLVPDVGDVITLRVPLPDKEALRPEALPLEFVYEDEHLLVVLKPAGIVVHPSPGHATGTLVNALLAHRPEVARADLDPSRPGIVHRLDRDTSGLLVVALNREAQRALQAAFKSRAVDKRYLTLLHGALAPERGAIEAPIGRDPVHRQRMAVLREGGRPARTEYRVREYLGAYSYVEALLLTGRTHQLRVHFAAIGHPVVGDPVYGRRRERLTVARQFLHAWRLAFEHPVTGERVEVEAPLPPDLAAVLVEIE